MDSRDLAVLWRGGHSSPMGARSRSSYSKLRVLRRQAAQGGDVADRHAWISTSLRHGQLPGIGREIRELPEHLRDQLARERVQRGRCAWCGGFERDHLRCCCAECYLEVGVLCFHCPKQQADAPPP